AVLVARLAIGAVFVAHGWQKASVWGHAGTTKAFTGMGVPAPSIAAFYSTWVELLGGLALALGVLTSIAGLLLFVDMLGACFTVPIHHGIFVTDSGYELVLALGATSLALALAGAGRFSVAALISKRGAAAVAQPAQ